MIQVRFYTFQKKLNSTAIPAADSGTLYNCTLLSGCGVITPRIVLQGSNNAFNPSAYNYAHIPAFSRYYYVTEWTYDSGLWSAALSVDVLASYRATIHGTTQYCSRTTNAAAVNDAISDVAIPAESTATIARNSSATPIVASTVESGCIVASMIAGALGNSPIQQGLRHFAFSVADWNSFFIALTSAWTDIAAFFGGDPLQGISRVAWCPFHISQVDGVEYTADPDYPSQGNTSGIRIGSVNIVGSYNFKYMRLNPTITSYAAIPLTQHPQRTIGRFINCEPYTTRLFVWPPVGSIPLNASLLADTAGLTITADLLTGTAIYEIDNGSVTIAQGVFDCGVAISLSNQTANILNVADSAFSIASSAQSGSITGVADGILSGIASFTPDFRIEGGPSSYLRYFHDLPRVVSTFKKVASTSILPYGRPCCKYINPLLLLNSYAEFPSPILSISGTSSELSEIQSLMIGGIWIE